MSNFEETRKPDISVSEVIKSLFMFFHDIEKSDIRFLYHGTYNVFEVKNKYIFRFPDNTLRNQKGVRLMQKEIKLLNIIRKFLSFIIPDPVYVSIEKENTFVGYEKIEGVSLSRCFHHTSKSQQNHIALEIGEFLSQLHSDQLKDAIIREFNLNFNLKEYEQRWNEYYDTINKQVFPLMNSNQKAWISHLFSKFLNDSKNFMFKPVVIHGDFDTSNILVDPASYKITGFIDFEDANIYDPAADFLFFKEGEYFNNKIISAYQGDVGSNFNERRKFFYGSNFLPYVIYGLEYNLPDMVNAGFQLLEDKMQSLN